MANEVAIEAQKTKKKGELMGATNDKHDLDPRFAKILSYGPHGMCTDRIV